MKESIEIDEYPSGWLDGSKKELKADVEMLRNQRDTLVYMIMSGSTEKDTLEGLINFSDAILDSLDDHGFVAIVPQEEA